MAPRPGLSLVALILIAGSLLLLWFVILSGVTTTTPLDKTYFLRADTAGITGARSISQWNYFYVCGDGNTNCGSASPAPPAGHAWAPNAANVPSGLAGSHGNHTTSARFFYMWRFGWAFYLIALFFMTLTFFSGFLACCGRLGAAISALFGVLSLIIYTAAVSLMTATFVIMRNKFNAAGRTATLGKYAFGFSWAAWFALLLATILFCLGIRKKDQATTGYTSRWGRTRSTRSRMSDVGGRRVKDEYA
ncbi:hypothetical protein DL546_001163 [Coniochaeta pulveracea]|uniref:Uncharacterized protein n=1 Tax=Coniochaeta pulveracea TaxID=177199 RepID=A0A420Y5Q8_9PEZI|nr:hypothetical protein DL546_001163 [Coniochaeta pulveracea]